MKPHQVPEMSIPDFLLFKQTNHSPPLVSVYLSLETPQTHQYNMMTSPRLDELFKHDFDTFNTYIFGYHLIAC